MKYLNRLNWELDTIAFDETKDLPRCDQCNKVFHSSKLRTVETQYESLPGIYFCEECWGNK